MATGLSLVTTKLERFIGSASGIANYIALGFLLIMPLPVFFDVIARFAFRGSIPGVIEIEGFILLIIVFLGIAFIRPVLWHDVFPVTHARHQKNARQCHHV
jgi:hypothetical protein